MLSTNHFRHLHPLARTIQVNAGLCVLLTLLAAGTRWFAFQGWKTVPFEIQDEVLLLWALKDFVLGSWEAIPYPITRFVASYALVPVLGTYFGYQLVVGAISAPEELIHSFFVHTSHGYDEATVWVWAPRVVSWISLVASVPLQYILTHRVTQSRIVALLAAVLLNFSFTHLYSSLFGLPDGLGFLLFQCSLLGLVAYERHRNIRTTVVFCAFIACMFLVRLQNAFALVFIGVIYLVCMRVKHGLNSWKSIGTEFLVIASCSTAGIVILNPIIYLEPTIVVQEFFYGLSEWTIRPEWNLALHLAYLSRVIFDEVLGTGLSLMTGLSVIVLAIRPANIDRVYR